MSDNTDLNDLASSNARRRAKSPGRPVKSGARSRKKTRFSLLQGGPNRRKDSLTSTEAASDGEVLDREDLPTLPGAKRASDPYADSVVINVRPMARPARFKLRHKGIISCFAIVVLLPALVAFLYLKNFAVNQYESTVAFTVRSAEIADGGDVLGGMGLMLSGGSARDTDILYEYIRSQELVLAVDEKLDLRAIYSRYYDQDPIFGFPATGTIEELRDYWGRMVRISYDSRLGLMELRILAFDPNEARAIAQAILEFSTKTINELSATARNDAMQYATEDLQRAQDQLKTAREALTTFRLANSIVDVNANIQGQMGLLNTLQAQMASALIEADLLRRQARNGDPRLEQAEARIGVIQTRIDEERSKFSQDPGTQNNYANVVAEYERLNVEREFAETTYLGALRSLEAASAEAARQSRYLATYIQPTLAQISEYPQNGLIIGLVALFSFLLFTIATLIFYSLRERR